MTSLRRLDVRLFLSYALVVLVEDLGCHQDALSGGDAFGLVDFHAHGFLVSWFVMVRVCRVVRAVKCYQETGSS